MLSFVAKALRTQFKSAKLQHTYHFDTSDINNFKFPQYINELTADELQNKITDIIKEYKKLNLKSLHREDVDELKIFTDMQILYLLKFYELSFGLEILDYEEIFPFWSFSYNIEPLQKEIDKIISHAYHKIEPNFCKWVQNDSYNFSVLDVTYLLYYFILTLQLESTTTDELE